MITPTMLQCSQRDFFRGQRELPDLGLSASKIKPVFFISCQASGVLLEQKKIDHISMVRA
jgi:hypothetical protein